MFNKQSLTYILWMCLSLGTCAADELNCTRVAKIHKIDALVQVSILRDGDKHEMASRDNRELCAGDTVKVPKSIPDVTIQYYSDSSNKHTVTAGDSYQVEALKEPCQVWCKVIEYLDSLVNKLVRSEPLEPPPHVPAGGDSRGEADHQPASAIFMVLAAGNDSTVPFDLFSREGPIPLFWRGGLPPYQIEVTDAADNVVVQGQTETNTFAMTLPDTDIDKAYTLEIRGQHSPPYQKPLIFSVPPFPIDPNADQSEQRNMLARLLYDLDNNWRLEIWRQLTAMPDSEEKRRFMGHLEMDDFDLEMDDF